MTTQLQADLPARKDIDSPAAFASGWGLALHPQGCSHCGAAFLAADDSSETCPACHATQLEPQPVRLRPEPPELVLPSTVPREQLVERIESWLVQVRLRPKDLNSTLILGRLKPGFLPLWLVDGELQANWRAEVGYDYEVASAQESFEGGEWRSHKITEARIRWEPRAGTLIGSYSNRLVPALADHAKIQQALGEFDYSAFSAYKPELLAGGAVRVPDLPPDEVWHLAEPVFERAAGEDCRRASDGQHIRALELEAEYSALNWTQMLVPVFSSEYRDDEGHVIPILINGQTGKVDGVLRASQRKGWVWSGGLAIIAIAFFILGALAALIGVVAPPLLAVAAVFFVVSLVVGVVAAIPAIYVWRWNARHAL